VQEIILKAAFQNQRLHYTIVFLFVYSYVKLSSETRLTAVKVQRVGKLWHSHASFVMLVCPCVRLSIHMENHSAIIGRINNDVLYLDIFLKSEF
jgi:uncharacterized membrane protein YfhO